MLKYALQNLHNNLFWFTLTEYRIMKKFTWLAMFLLLSLSYVGCSTSTEHEVDEEVKPPVVNSGVPVDSPDSEPAGSETKAHEPAGSETKTPVKPSTDFDLDLDPAKKPAEK